MCKFASFIMTKDSELWGPTESHSSIIEHHQIHEDGCRGPNILRVEISPPDDDPRAPLEKWTYVVDQDQFPEWHDPIRSKERARAALVRRAELERWLVHEDVATGGHCISGYASTLTGGNRSTLTGGDDSTLTGGYASTLTGGDDSTLTGGDDSYLIVRWWDSAAERYRIAVGQIGQDGLEPGKKYRWDSTAGKFSEVTE